MESTTDLRLVLSRELDTQELSLEHDTLVASPEFTRRVIDALHPTREVSGSIDLPVPAGS